MGPLIVKPSAVGSTIWGRRAQICRKQLVDIQILSHKFTKQKAGQSDTFHRAVFQLNFEPHLRHSGTFSGQIRNPRPLFG